MKCPRCGLIVTDEVPRCLGCGFTLEDLDRRLGKVPGRLGLVNDLAKVLSDETKSSLESRLQAFRRARGGEIVLVAVSSTTPIKPSEYVFWLFNRWEVGGPGHEGLMLLLAMQERRIESEVGYGWEDIASDVETGAILDEYVVPLLKEGKLELALTAAVERLASLFEAGPTPRG
jgi:uncharacterized protein